jgi:signal transduction histidine kinase
MKDGLGINQIDARIQIMNGFFFIESSAKNGTSIVVELPVIEKKLASHAFPIQ